MKMETIEDIVAEMRKRFEPYAKSDSNDARYVAYLGYAEFADRIEAAEKHHFRDLTKTIPHEEVAVRDAANSELLNSIKSYQINSSKAREALEEIRAYVADMVCRSERNESLRKAIYNSARYALSAPPRNVDRFNKPDEALSAYCEDKGITQPLPLWYSNEFWAFINWLLSEAKGDEK